ncbi:hypothetical protein [Desulfovibrio subterraneus]|uniref:hypothetical protein n=1 Tax=Desulfovibrio subterraneus TaxID=2718620 RepID=UPI00157B6FBF|nr:hypothetical protein [Desulfovibrio subterraneus]
MDNSFTTLACPSPEIEASLWDPTNKTNAELFYTIKNEIQNIKSLIFLAIPIEIKPAFHSNMLLNMFMETIESDPQINIGFVKSPHRDGCKNTNTLNLFPNEHTAPAIYNFIASTVHNEKLPFSIGGTAQTIKKETCNACGRGKPCSITINIPQITANNINTFKTRIKQICQTTIDTWYTSKPDTDHNKIKILSYLLACLHDTPENLLPKQDSYLLHPDIIHDIRKSTTPLEHIVFSLFRSYAYPSRTSPEGRAITHSIDWHPNTPKLINGYTLYRIDVLPPTRTGIKTSGPRRLLLGVKNNTKYYLAYTDSHDFSRDLITTRTSLASNLFL